MAEEEPIGWLESVVLEGSEEPVRVTIEDREGSRLILRQIDPAEPEPPRVPIYEGDEVVVMQAISHMGMHTSAEVGDNSGFLFGYRVIPVRREPGVVYARTLRHGEEDTGERVHVRAGESVKFEAGSVVVELDHIDRSEPPSRSGYVPLTPVLWAWLSLGRPNASAARIRYLLSAARRLDTANLLLITVEEHRRDLTQNDLAAPAARRMLFELIGAVELVVVALGRALDMVRGAVQAIDAPAAVPEAIAESETAITAIRNAYEHIEDRALGKVRGKPDPVALTIFNHDQLLRHDRIVYGDHVVELAQVPQLLQRAREFFLEVAGTD